MSDIPATEKQLAFLKQLTGKDYSDLGLTAKEVSRKIEEITGKKEDAKKPNGKSGSSDASIEGQVAYHYIMEAFIAGKLSEEHCAVHTALGWAVTKMGGSLGTTTKRQSPIKEEPPTKTPEDSPLKNAGELFSRCLTINVDRAKAMELLGISQPKDIVDLDQAWQIIKATVS